VTFCNFDDGDSGFCESCSNFECAEECYCDGLPGAGASDCALRCFGVEGDDTSCESYSYSYASVCSPTESPTDSPADSPTESPTVDKTEDEDDDDDDVCFSGDDTVTLESGLSVRLTELNIGDRILSATKAGGLHYSDVVFLPHETNSKLATFVEMTTSAGHKLRATKGHLIVTCSGVTAYAGSLTIGQCVRTATGDDLIETLATVRSTGIYTAVIKNDYLVVGGIVSSPFAWNHNFVSAYYNLHRLAYDLVPSLLHVHALSKANTLLGSFATNIFVALAGKSV